jgi:cbb3-type cytochrome oxidase subunit 3
MNAILLTAFIGLVLATLFLVLFLYQLENRRYSSNERESLMPLQDEQVRPVSKHEPHAENPSDRP